MAIAKPPTAASPAPRPRPKAPRRIDPLGLGALLFAAIGFVAVLILFGPTAQTPSSAPLEVSRLTDTHHPVDVHEDGAQAVGIDVHHPVDRHDEP
jgi:hypothetical protein